MAQERLESIVIELNATEDTMNKRRIWEIFPVIFGQVRGDHEAVGLHGHHDIFHAARVGDMAYNIALAEEMDDELAQLAGLAGLCHNADRILGVELKRQPTPNEITELVMSWVASTVAPQQMTLVIEAVLKHSQRNGDDDSPILVALMDADRVINLDLDVVMRGSQHFHELPTVDYVHYLTDPAAKYNQPRSVLRDIAYCLDWVDPTSGVCVRTKLGKTLAEERADKLKGYISDLKEQLEEEGILPSPF